KHGHPGRGLPDPVQAGNRRGLGKDEKPGGRAPPPHPGGRTGAPSKRVLPRRGRDLGKALYPGFLQGPVGNYRRSTETNRSRADERAAQDRKRGPKKFGQAEQPKPGGVEQTVSVGRALGRGDEIAGGWGGAGQEGVE